jgi:putative DNA primase/helicase
MTRARLLEGSEGNSGQAYRVAHRFALIAASGELAAAALGLPWKQHEAERAAAVCFEAWRSTLGGDGPGELVAAMDAIRAAVEKHGESRFRNLSSLNQEAPVNGQGIRDLLGYRFERDSNLYWGFTATGWREVLAGIADPKSIACMLAEKGDLLTTPSDRLNRLMQKIDGRTVGTYAVRASALSY